MEITLYDSNGTIKETKSIDLQVPKYVKEYDELNSFLNITAEDVEIVNSRKNTFRKAILLRQLTTAIKHDYANFRDAYKLEVESLEADIDVFIQEAESNPQIHAGDRIMSSIIRIYRHSGVYIDEQTFLEQTCTKEEFLIYINKVERQTVGEDGNNNSSNWIKVILYHAFKSARTTRLKYGDVDDNTRFYISLQNLINRYYYSLRNMMYSGWMPAELYHQMHVLFAFVKKIDIKSFNRFDESSFFIRLTTALYYIHEEQRSYLYKMAGTVLRHTPSIMNKDGNLILFKIDNDAKPTKPIDKPHALSFNDYNKRKAFSFKINDEEICALRVPSSNNIVLLTLQNELVQLYNEYVKIRQDKWKGSVEIDAKIFFNKNKVHYEDWADFYYYEIEKYKYGLSGIDLLKPQRSFYHLICDNIEPNKSIGFNREIVAGLIEILIEYPCNSQEGLYECIFRMKYIQEMDTKDITKVALNKAMKFIGRLFEDDCTFVRPYYKPSFKQLMCQILSLKGIKEKLVKPAPTKNFKGGFNLSLVYNILGVLQKASIISGGAGEIDYQIHKYAYDKGLIDKITERKTYIYDKKEIGNDMNSINAVIGKYINTH